MSKAHADIEADLAYSKKLHGLTTGHQQETNQLLENIEQLQEDVRILLDVNNELRETNAAKDALLAKLQAHIAELQSRIAELEVRPTNIYADQLVGVQNVAHQDVRNQLITGNSRKRTAKNKYLDLTNQLTLWPNTTTSL